MILSEEYAAPCPADVTLASLRRDYGGGAVAMAAADADADADVPPTPPRFARRAQGTLGEWISTTLSSQRGVIAALPRALWPAGSTIANGAAARVVALDATRALGHNRWWLRALQATPFSTNAAFSLDARTSVYKTEGVEFPLNWVPTEVNYSGEVDPEAYEVHSVAGLAVHVREVPLVDGRRPAALVDAKALQQRTLLEVEAAAHGLAPAIFASFVVHDADDYRMPGALPDAGARAAAEPVRRTASTGIVAAVTVTQAHAFRLSDLLGTYDVAASDALLRPRIINPQIEGTIYETTAAVARKVRQLARNRTIKLNLKPGNVVFVPKLVEDDAGELAATGYGFFDGEHDVTKGVPQLVDFDPKYTRRFPTNVAAYSADAAYAASMLSLLAHAKAKYIDVHRLMLHKLTGLSPTGAALGADELPERFEDDLSLAAALRRARDAGALRGFCALVRGMADDAGDEPLQAALAQAAQDLADLGRTPLADGSEYGGDRNVFQALVAQTGGDARADTAVFAPRPGEEELAERQRVRGDVRRLHMAVEQRRLRKLQEGVSG